jgi:hypothetical protein
MPPLRLALPLTLFFGSLACSPSGTPSIPTFEWITEYRVAAFSQDDETAFVVEQSYERNQIISVAYARSEFRVQEHAFRTDGAITDVHDGAIRGTVWNLFPRDDTGWLLLDGVEGQDRTRALWRLDMDGQVEQLESLPSELWDPDEGMWQYLPSPDGHQVARIFHRYTLGDQGEADHVEALTGLTVPPLGLIVTFLDAQSGAELSAPVVVQAPDTTAGGRPSAYPYWQTHGTLMLTDGVDFAREITVDGELSEIPVPTCLHAPTPGWISQSGEILELDRSAGTLTLGTTEETPFGCP